MTRKKGGKKGKQPEGETSESGNVSSSASSTSASAMPSPIPTQDQEGRGRGRGAGIGRGSEPPQAAQHSRGPLPATVGQPVPQWGARAPTPVQTPQPGQQQYRPQQPPLGQQQQPPPGQQQYRPQQAPWGQQQQRPQQPPPGQQQYRPQQPPPGQQQQPTQQPQQKPQQPTQQPQQKPQQQQRPVQQQQAPKQQQAAQPASQQITAALSTKMEDSSMIPRRKNPLKAGTAGRPITVEANVVSISFSKNFNPNAVHYDVAFDPDKPKFMLRRAYNVVHSKYFPNRHPAFDGRKNLYSTGLLPFGETMTAEVDVHDPERDQMRKYKVTINKVADVDMSWLPHVAAGMAYKDQTAIQVMDVVLRQGPAARCVPVGRSFFSPPPGRVVDLGNGLELWVGMFQSAILGWKTFLNVDVAHKGFPKAQNVVDLMKEMCGQRFPADIERMRQQISKHLKGLKVVYEIPGHPTSKRTQRVNELVDTARNSRFKLDNGAQTTVYDYFLKEKNYRIQMPDIPCVWVGGRNRQVYVPAELCTIVSGQVTMKKMDEIQTSNMIKSAATSSQVRKQKIMDAFASINFNNDPCVREFGLSVGGGFERVPARVLDPPVLEYNTNQKVRPSRGVWRAARFNKAAKLEAQMWTILNLNKFTREGDLHNLADELIKNGRQCGMEIGPPLTPFAAMDAPTRDVRRIIEFLEKNKRLQLVIVVLPDRGNAYSKVKQTAELKIGVLTQCVRARTISRLSPATTCNILLKINSKLNGTNHLLAPVDTRPPCLNKPCIIIGADVTHPSPDAVDIPSIAAVAASHDARAQFMYNTKTQLQPPREEIILDLQRMVKEQLLFFYKQTGHKPEKIIFYRDGVSEGQFQQVLSRELPAIQRACASLQAGYRPPITFLVVQKRHHVRLFPTDQKNSDDRNFNVQAGTVVDTVITHPSHIDFYLVSHASIQGVARPTKYRCLWDDSNMSEDEIEQLTYHLCHMFSRCTRSVSYPAPTYYAHLAAYRARVHTEEVQINISNLDEEQRTKLTLADSMKTMPMYFV